ncbi:MAG: hypothetical protein JXB62_17245 [Pirellulales bacterium]|nr:hypothetical protein [Pirellulales bacterium]
MRETVIYVRGDFPFGPEYRVPDGLIRDSRVLLELDLSLIESIRDELLACPGFLDRKALEDLLCAHVDSEESCRRLARLVAGIDERLRGTGQGVKGLLLAIKEWLADEENRKKGLLSEEEFEEVRKRLPLIAGPFPGHERQAKAEQLSQTTGMPLKKIEMICDLRPVFDKGRDVVEGMIPYTTLRIVCTGADGLPVATEAILSCDDVAQLAKASADAKKKLERLQQFMREKNVSIPRVAITLEDDEK